MNKIKFGLTSLAVCCLFFNSCKDQNSEETSEEITQTEGEENSDDAQFSFYSGKELDE